MDTEMNLGKAWRQASQDEISKPMEPVPGRIAFLKRLGYLEGELHKLTLVEFDQLYRQEKKNHPYKLQIDQLKKSFKESFREKVRVYSQEQQDASGSKEESPA